MNHSNLLPEVLEYQSTQSTLNFEYSVLNRETQVIVQEHTNEIKALMRRSAQDIVNIGQKLLEVKHLLRHGNFINWLQSEFNWSISTANKFMQVAEQLSFVNFKNLNITASALYLIAAPSTPEKARKQVLELASLGENISYTKAKDIVYRYKKTVNPKIEQIGKIDKNVEHNSCISIEAKREPASLDVCATDEQELEIKSHSPLSKDSLPYITSSPSMTDAVITEIANSIKKLTPEQLALVITKSIKSGLSAHQLKAIIMASQQALNTSCSNSI